MCIAYDSWYIKLTLFLTLLNPGLDKGKKMFSCQLLWHRLYFYFQHYAVVLRDEAGQVLLLRIQK